MAIKTIGDMFARAKGFEGELEVFYSAIRDQSEDNGVRLLTYYLSRHRKHLDDVLSTYGADFLHHIESIELKYDIPFHPETYFMPLDTPPLDITGHQLLEAAVKYDSALVDLYKAVLEQPIIEQAREVFLSLIKNEECDIVMLKKMIAMDYF